MTSLSDSALERLTTVVAGADLERYELLEEIGRGGVGVVYRARDGQLERDVALKVLHAPFVDAPRLLQEARILAQLEHPGIVPVHDVGMLDDGRAFYVMKLVHGRRLDEAVASAPLTERLRIVDRLCEPIAFAHARGVIHRDLKPQNIMIGSFGEVLVLDWGTAAVRGTPGFMAPEQASTGPAVVDARTDVHALGSILSMMIAGRPDLPDDAEPRPVAAIARRARQRHPEDRYQTVAALAADLRRFLAGDAVDAHREGPIERLTRIVVRYRTPLLLVAAYLVMRIALLLAF